MKKKTLTAFIVALAMIHGTVLQTITRAQEAPPQQPAATSGSVSINNQSGRVQIKLERGSHVAISNRFGRITITGWDRDTVEATATSDKGAEAVQVEMTADPAASHTLLTLNVPGRPGQRGMFPFVYANPNIDINPLIYTNPNTNPNPNPDPPDNPNPNPPDDPNPGAQVQGATTPAPKAKPAKPVKAKPPANNDSNVIIVPIPDMSDMPMPEIPEAALEREGVAAPSAPPRQRSAVTAKGSTRGIGGGTGGGMGGGVGGGVVAGGMVGRSESSSSGISLHVKMPRYATLETIEVRSGDVNISDIDSAVSISSGSSNITVARVGALEVRARSGNINVDGVEGLVYIVASSGTISVRRTKGDVRATSINGDINLHCIKGRVDASNARGGIVLGGVEGDVEASTTDADINFVGAIRPQGRYRLKSMEGRVIMAIPETSPGFTAVLSSYNKDVVTTFPIATEQIVGGSPRVNRRVVVKQGDGGAQITLDSFSQSVHLVKLGTGATGAPCQ
jgi:hypothetical protein